MSPEHPGRPGSGSAAPIVVVSGNPRAGSRTLRVARTVADLIAVTLPGPSSVTTLELIEIASELFATRAPTAEAYRQSLARASVAVIATPVYKASYTGLLKAFLDGYPSGGLRGVLAVPVVVSASPAHAFVGDHLLHPLLVELGAVVPTRAFAVTESRLDDLDRAAESWAAEALPVLRRLTVSTTQPGRPGS